jgi:hypothetical protein
MKESTDPDCSLRLRSGSNLPLAERSRSQRIYFPVGILFLGNRLASIPLKLSRLMALPQTSSELDAPKTGKLDSSFAQPQSECV